MDINTYGKVVAEKRQEEGESMLDCFDWIDSVDLDHGQSAMIVWRNGDKYIRTCHSFGNGREE